MKSKFPHYYQLTSDQFENLWKDCVFILDANVLLNLYRYPPKARTDLLRLLRAISELNRVWVPFQAALEFQANRLTVIADHKAKFGGIKNVIGSIQADLKKKIDGLQLRKRHSSINPDLLINSVARVFDTYIRKLDALESEQLDVHQEDTIRSQLDTLLSGAVGDAFTQAELDKIYADGEARYKVERPPGYRDASEKKDTLTFCHDLTIKRKFGDLIVWKEIIRYIQLNKPNGVVFVTDDSKDDWWMEVAGKIFGPRPDLLSELHKETQLRAFHMYSSEHFMTKASAVFKVPVRKDSITQVRRVSTEFRPDGKVQLCAKLLRTLYGGKCQVCGFDAATEVASIRSSNANGSVAIDNMLLLCPNHHRLLDLGAFSIADDFQLLGLGGVLSLHSDHRIDTSNLKYHRDHVYELPAQGLPNQL